MSEEKKSKGGVWQFIKFALFSASAGIIQILSFTLMSEVIIKLPALQNLMNTNATFEKNYAKRIRPYVPYCASSFSNLELYIQPQIHIQIG